jgi:hypothetical protein
MAEELVKAKPASKQFEFIPKLKGKKVVIRLDIRRTANYRDP